MKRLLRGLAERFGYTIVPTWQLDRFPAERYLARLFRQLDIDLVLDVGANAGQYYTGLRRNGYRGQIVSFEPNPTLASGLTARAKADPRWMVDSRALGSAPGSAEFQIMQDSEFSSFHAPRHDSVSLFHAQNTVCQKVSVQVTTLDQVLPDLMQRFSAKRVYLKMDTQGHDMEVLKGAEHVLGQIAALQTEATVLPIYEEAPTYQDMIPFLISRGFLLSGIFPNNSGHFPLLIEFDCYMISKSLAPKPSG